MFLSSPTMSLAFGPGRQVCSSINRAKCRTDLFVAIAGHIVTLNSRFFGVSQTYYTTHVDNSTSQISWIGSVQIPALFFIETLSGRLTDPGCFRITFAAGTLFTCLGVFTTSLSTTFWQLLLSQSLCTGLGNGLMFTPSLAVVSTYFKRRRAFGITATGSAAGGPIFPSMARQLLGSIGFACAVGAMGLMQLITLDMANLLLRPRIPPRQSVPWIDLVWFKREGYLFFAIGIFTFWTTFFPFYCLTCFAVSQLDKTLTYSAALNILLVVNGVGIIGRSLPNAIAHHFGSITVLIPVVFISSKCLFTWPAVSTEAGSYAWASAYGIVAGASMSLFPPALPDLRMVVHKTGVRMGMIFTTNSIATLTGPPIAGMITRRSGGHYLSAQIFAGASLLLQLRLVAESLNQ
ncbi:related to monocarboxylate transporter 4 [Fusarium fujikuroi IMI 58289]|uniref:Related to monocarboxylate transporter 4 n=1 Tax=Gibberella fujikuroi (strain CBS 195.34 / IMI 58289 / NRRL A-6831) TaxID=1279085 RepID=S0E349_GIBF5|nr:related to monocarboxylate transporter 4 [Fusarium fujikuroi IMI 58289]CCT69080.1 related to monocarboxylate transporter 4 [Fusarium fujikuroi IMI 58289]SCO07923.1 related to monocarboxylate transporter 4 [Fusarium fujikuroi]